MSDIVEKDKFIRSREIKGIETEVMNELSQVPNENQAIWLSKKITALLLKLYSLKYEDERLRVEAFIDVYKEKLEQMSKFLDDDIDEQLWQGYPELNDPEFNKKIYEKQEFYKYKIPKKGLDQFNKKPSLEFTKNETQRFIGAYMSPSTPYNGLLLWLGVGVGKTCAAITAAENYRKDGGEFTRSKILVLLPSDSLVQTWKDELFNVDKDIENKNRSQNVQCTGATFYPELGFYDEMNRKQKERRVNRVINKYYDFMGYRKFSNQVLSEIKKELKGREDREYVKLQVIRKKYSNRIFIFDEVHYTREYASKNDRKDITEVLEMIARYGENNKFILASATPMYNSADEIIEILNLLLLNDKRAPIETHQVFKSDGFELTEEGKEILIDKSRGYISFLRGENPINFPVKIYPDLEYPVQTYIPNPIYKLVSGEPKLLKDDQKIKNLRFVKNSMSKYQYNIYKQIAENEEKNKDNFSIPSTQASNIVFPNNTSKEIVDLIGDNGFDNVFTSISLGEAKEDRSNLKFQYKDYNAIDENGIPFLDEKRLAKYSKKYFNILQLAKNSTGILFLFSRYLKPGILSLALMLEQNGYAQYNLGGVENNMLDYPVGKMRCYCGKLSTEHKGLDHSFKQGKYIYLTGSTPKSTLNKLIKASKGEGDFDNLYGQNIKFIIGSEVLEEGINMKNVREVHVIDPWYHFNRLEQVVGRAIRNKSHIRLPPEMRNVSVFLHISTIPEENQKTPDLNIETTDEKNYRLAYYKSKKIAIITRILKQNAVDCMLNKNGNQLTVDYFNRTPLNILTSQGFKITNRFYGDQDYDAICDYDTCVYSCIGEPKGLYIPKINTDTYDDILSMEDLSDAKRNISSLFRIKNAYTVDEMIGLIDKYFETDRDLTYRAIQSMVENKDAIYDMYKREGYISYTNPFYIFTPREFNNEFSSFYTRSIPLPVRKNIVEPTIVKPQKEETQLVGNKFIKSFKDFIVRVGKDYIKNNNIYGELAKEINNEFAGALGVDIGANALNLVEKYFIFSMIDRLTFEQKRLLISNVLTDNIKKGGKISLEGNNLDNIIFEMYDKKGASSRYSIFRQKRDLGENDQRDLPVLFRLYRLVKKTLPNDTVYLDYQMIFYQYNFNKSIFEEVIDPIELNVYTEKFGFNYSILKTTEDDKIYGYLQDKEFKVHSKVKANEEELGVIYNEPEFYLVNRRNHVAKKNKDDTLQQKSEIKGAVCGTCTDKAELINIIKYILDLDIDKPVNFEIFLKEKSKVNKHLGSFDKEKILAKSGSLCEIIELLLRHRQFIEPMGHFFYNYEEWLFVRNIRAIQEQELRKKEEEAKIIKPKASRGRKPAAKQDKEKPKKK